jgi:hypothetical protein
MKLTDLQLNTALQAAVNRIRTTAGAAAERTAESLGIAALSAAGIRQRDAYLAAQFELGRKVAVFNQRFGEVFMDKASREAAPRGPGAKAPAATDWQSLSLVEDDEVEELVAADRMGQTITHECEWELRELATYMGSVLGTGRAEQERNPLRPEVIGRALFRAIEAVSSERDTRKLLMREVGLAMAQSMRGCYRDIISDLQSRGVQPVGLTVKTVEGPGNELPRETLRQNSAYETGNSRFDSRFDMSHDDEMMGWVSGGDAPATTDPGRRSQQRSTASSAYRSSTAGGYRSGTDSMHGARRQQQGVSRQGDSGHGSAGRDASGRTSRSGRATQPGPSSDYGSIGAVDPQMMELIRRIAFLGSRPVDVDVGAPGPGSGHGGLSARNPGSRSSAAQSLVGAPLSDLMAANMILAHREELRQASTGALDHMVIDVVASLFDQILSDPKVPPQMARQIARLQLPVLRVALGDVTFFSSRRHPVRRFVNRIASLACAFEDFSEGPGFEFLTRVRDLVQQIVEGDFDQMELYEKTLSELEDFIRRQTEKDVQERGDTTALLQGKETELRLQQRYMQTLKSALTPLAMPDFLRDFLSQVWSQAIVRAVQRDGAQSEQATRMRTTGRELVMSVQPKGSPAHRKNFLLKLPKLMKDLNDGLTMIGWPEAAKKDFFGKLLPAHAESLKGQPLSELDYNLLASELDTILSRSIPKAEELSRTEAIPELTDVVLDHRFSAEEAQQIGLVPESAVDWDGQVDIDLSAGPESQPLDTTDLDINIDGLPPPEPPEPTQGAALVDHMQIGCAYQMHLKDGWHKVRLSHVSPGRAFFVFTRGKRHQETISMTARMMVRMSETGRVRPFENAYLLERATARARKQLAALGAASSTRH